MIRSLLLATSLIVSGALLPMEASAAQPANVGDAIIAASAYHDSGDYQRDFDSVVAQARLWIDEAAPKTRRPAIVLDIDETTLSNWDEIRADDFGYIAAGPCDALPKGPCGAIEWEKSGRAPAFASMRALIENAQAHHVAVFFVTGRHEDEREATERNLHLAGIRSWDGLYLRPMTSHGYAALYKAPTRERIERKGYTIIASLGDQPSDLSGGFAKKTFLLPNPFYRIP
ncbi:HAD family acid phosphatase [Gluconobacter kanchanaburiensis]|uniref:Acid phosphatase n=1 Tax=Gluconobacter kanchanaburiensis NBRC 103587 TaxID=1307948 RepID=A0A511B400_9PROT|nr:HAD family acid phosphatase [Gluconobacter kanchanaburiensis]MBF0860679.1 acid phosphatase [Gluconobacter kanchanaburiensis]GBR69596.1 acid phosphatase [Gluconobacter kanchanaburiensis NBRC 103587]GEK95144.1 acid phosphatase [Gluconobacter kanchanaburiensis NBRC 103587]